MNGTIYFVFFLLLPHTQVKDQMTWLFLVHSGHASKLLLAVKKETFIITCSASPFEAPWGTKTHTKVVCIFMLYDILSLKSIPKDCILLTATTVLTAALNLRLALNFFN